MPFDAQSGLRLREERKRVGLTQQEMADKAGVRREMWSKYERGVAAPGAGVFRVIAELGMDQLYILTGVDASPDSAPQLSADEVELIELYRAAPLKVKAAVIAVLTEGNADTGKSKKTVIKGAKGGRIAGNNYYEQK